MRNIMTALRRSLLPCLMALCLLLCACGGAKESGITVKNDLGCELYHLYISPSDSSEWGDDRLSKVMNQQDSVTLMLSELVDGQVGKDGAVFDVFAEDEDGGYYSFYSVRLADGDSLSLSFDKGNSPIAKVIPKKGDARITAGTFDAQEPQEETNPFLGYWIATGEDYSIYVFAEDGEFLVLNRETGDLIGGGSYTYNGSESVITVAEGDATPVTVFATLVSETDLIMEFDGERILLTRVDESDIVFQTPSTPPITNNDRTYTREDNGMIKYRDYTIGIWLSYPDTMSVSEDYFPDAVLVYDGEGGHVLYRDVTDEYLYYSGSDDAFTTHYVEEYVQSYYGAIYESENINYTDFELMNSSAEGRIGTAQINLYSSNYDIQVRCIIYSATYDNGDVRILAKFIFANYGDDAQMQALADGVRGGACRR